MQHAPALSDSICPGWQYSAMPKSTPFSGASGEGCRYRKLSGFTSLTITLRRWHCSQRATSLSSYPFKPGDAGDVMCRLYALPEGDNWTAMEN